MPDSAPSATATAGRDNAAASPLAALSALRNSALGSVLIATLSVAALLGMWQALAVWYKVPVWLVPRPSDFLARLVADWQPILRHALATSRTILTGFALGVLIAVPLAMLIVSVGALRRGLYPVIVFLNIMPKTVVGPILIVWFGIGPLVAALIVFLMCFFPILVDSMSGFGAIDKRLLYISRSMGANRWQTFWKIELPDALPHIFAGMKIGVVKAVEGVIIAEFIASNAGLGFMIMQASGFMDMTLMFAGLIAAALVALVFNGGMSIVERLLMPWKRT